MKKLIILSIVALALSSCDSDSDRYSRVAKENKRICDSINAHTDSCARYYSTH